MIVETALGAIVAGSVVHGAFHRNSPMFGRVLSRLPTADAVVALTFDDGPNPEATPRILDALGARNVHATFFILGRHAERWPQLVERVSAEGHTLANHGFHHRKLHLKSPAYVLEDIQLGTRRIEEATGRRPRWFRAPHGFRSPWVTPIARRFGQRTVGWSLGVWDSDRPGSRAIAERTIAGTKAGSILLLHDGDGYDANGDRSQTADAVPLVVDELQARGFRFIGLDDAI